MSRKSKVLLAALAAAASLGVVQMAAGEAISQSTLAERFEALAETTGAAGIDRRAKTDREIEPARTGVAGRTVLLRVDGLGNTSVLVRIPAEAEEESRSLSPASPVSKPSDPKPSEAKPGEMVACEPVVSVLTEVAKLLQPGRCVT